MQLIQPILHALRSLAATAGLVPEAEARATDEFRSLVQQAAMEAIWLAQHEYLHLPASTETNDQLHVKVLFLGARAENLYTDGDFKEALAIATDCLHLIREAAAAAQKTDP